MRGRRIWHDARVASSIPTIIAPGAERIMHAGSWWQVFFSELTPTPGRWKSTLRATVAMIVGIALTALVGESSFVMCAVAAMTESTPGTVHSPSLLFKRFGTSAACGLFSIMLVATFPQAPMLLFVGILAGIWMVLYLVRLLPVGASGLRVAIWTFAPLFSVPLNDPAGFDRMAALSVLGVSSGVAISYAAALLVFPGAESVRARYAVNGLLQESAARLRAIADALRTDTQGAARLEALEDVMSPSVLAHIAVLSEAIATYAVPNSGFPELVPLTRLASLSDSAAVHLAALARQARTSDSARAAAIEMAERLSDFFLRVRGLSFERHWARDGDHVPALEALIGDTEALIRAGDQIIEHAGPSADEITLSLAGYARRSGGTLRAALTDRPLPAGATSAALALPLGFPPASPLGKAPTILAALSQYDPAAATSASAAVFGMALALVLSALFLPGGTGPAAIGAVFVLQSTVGGSGRRGLLRLLGTVIGGSMAAVALTIFASGVQDFGAYLCIMGVMAFMSAWVFVGSPRSNYAGLMMAAAWIIVIASDQQPADSLTVAVERVFSVIVAGLCVTFSIWMFATTTARVATMASIASGWHQIAELLRRAQMLPFDDTVLREFRERNRRATANLASTCDLREQYAFEARMRSDTFAPVLQMLAEQQRVLLLARSFATGRFHDHPLPIGATEPIDASLRLLADRLDALGTHFSESTDAQAWQPCNVPTPATVRAAAVANGCNAQDVARLIYRRDALALLEESVIRARAAARRNFIWHHGELHSGIEMFDGKRTYAQVFPILAEEPR